MQTITVLELKETLEKNPTLHLIDVREPAEHQEFNIGGKLIPLGYIQSLQLDEIEDLKNEPIYLYCRSGNRSGQACMILESIGFKNVTNVLGGMLAWKENIK
ncbi:MAG: rhodanese-like domain-containing protein [Sediminibacterium sp.]|nr:rhodanese-like domain-containing protein [Sediminibacterium sp.]